MHATVLQTPHVMKQPPTQQCPVCKRVPTRSSYCCKEEELHAYRHALLQAREILAHEADHPSIDPDAARVIRYVSDLIETTLHQTRK